MARNGSGNYTKVNTFTAGTPITAASHNQNWDDVAAEITNSVAADGQTTMTGPLKAATGTAGAPSHSFGSDPDTGGYRSGSNEYSVAAGGVQITKVSSAGLDIKSGGLLVNGVAVAAAADGAALSVLGVTGNAIAPRADMAAATDGHVLRRSGAALGFGTLATGGISDGAVTLAKQADLVAGAFIVRHTASTGVPQAGSFGPTLSLSTSTGALNVAVPAAQTFISSAVAATSAALTFTGLDSTYREHIFEIDSLLPSTDDVYLISEVSTDNGSSWITTSYKAGVQTADYNGTTAINSATSSLVLTQPAGGGAGLDNGTGNGYSGTARLRTVSSSSVKKMFSSRGCGLIADGSTLRGFSGDGFWNGGNTAINAIRFRFSSGNIASGTITMYGIKGS